MRRIDYECDLPGCTASRREVNHWFIAIEGSDEVVVRKWNAEAADLPGAKHLCGTEHVQKLVGMWTEGSRGKVASKEGLTYPELARETREVPIS